MYLKMSDASYSYTQDDSYVSENERY